MSQIKHFTADRNNPFTHRYHILTIRKNKADYNQNRKKQHRNRACNPQA